MSEVKMRIFKITIFLLVFSLAMTACQPAAVATPTEVATPEVITATAVPISIVPTATSNPLPTATTEIAATATTEIVATATTAPSGSSGITTLPDISSSNYLDDRSTPAALMLSYVNAINRHEYIRGYSYWIAPGGTLGTLDAFTNSLSAVSSESIKMGTISSSGAAGSIYYSFPVVFVDSLSAGGTKKYAGCFILRLPQPANYGEPPIQPLNIDRGSKTLISSSTSDADALASACSSADYPAGETAVPSVESISDLSANNYIDNRSGAVEVVSSLLNALNNKEYVRAYSYWQNPSFKYDSYAAGFTDTGSVTATFGTVTSDAGAGQYYYQIPVAEKVITTSNAQQTFVGCYTLHLSNPGMQGMLPFEPLGIKTGKFSQVANNANITSMLTTACN
jgi:hypothetical protein